MFKEVGNYLRVLREYRGYTQESLANKLQIDNSQVYDWENGLDFSNVQTFIKFITLIGGSITDLNYLISEKTFAGVGEILAKQWIKTQEFSDEKIIDLPKQVKIHEAARQLMAIMSLLLEDVDYGFFVIDDMSNKGYVSEDMQIWYRSVIRSLFACIEGVVYRMKQFSIEYDGVVNKKMNPKIYSLLLETESQLNNENKVIKIDKFIPLQKNILFAFDIFSYVHNCQYSIKTSNHHWRDFKEAIKIRNRITHPKTLDNIIISEEEILLIRNVKKWFNDIFQEIYNQTQAENDKFIAEKEREVEEAKKIIFDESKKKNNGQIRRKDDM